MPREPRIFRLPHGLVTIREAQDGVWQLSYDPDADQQHYPGHTYGPGDPDLPADYPRTNDPDELEEWARRRWAQADDRRASAP